MNRIVFILFFLSGTCGLMYQIVWSRIATHVFGATVFAVSTVLAAFMVGLALGSYFGGKLCSRASNQLKLYAYCELGIGVTGLVSLFLLERLTPLCGWLNHTIGYSFSLFSIVRFGLVFLLILGPSILMGATLPILSSLVVKRLDRLGGVLSGLYAVNTIGAVCGCLLAGFFLIGRLGVHNTVYLTVVLNMFVGCIAWIVANRYDDAFRCDDVYPRPESADAVADTSCNVRLYRLVLLCFAVSGFTSFAYEVFWTRALVFFLGNSTYAFTTMLTTFLVGIAAGGFAARFFVDRLKHPLRCFAFIEVMIGITAAVALPLMVFFTRSSFFMKLIQQFNNISKFPTLTHFVLALLVMLVPTLLIGMTFPIVCRLLVRKLDRTGAEVGKVYAFNTLGNTAGALIPGFVILPMLGIHRGILLMASVNFSLGLVIFMYGSVRPRRFRHFVIPACVILITATVIMPVNFQFPSDTQDPWDKVVYYKEGVSATTKVFVKHESRDKHMSVDGIQISGTNPEIDYKQQWLAHLPKLLLNRCNTELSVGLGSGILVGESSRHRNMEKIVCVEISPTVVEGARFFAKENYGILDSPRFEMVVNDGVNYLLTTSEKYDIISTDAKTHAEYGNNGVFFSREYYELMRDHLTPGGLAMQWFPLHYPPNIFRIVLKTFTDVFPYSLLWYADNNCFLVGSNKELVLDTDQMLRKLNKAGDAFDGIKKFGITTPEALLSHCVAASDILRDAVSDAEENSIDKPIIEFYSPGDYAVPSKQRELKNLEFILGIRGKGRVGEQIRGISEKMVRTYASEGVYLRGQRLLMDGGRKSDVEVLFSKALAMAPDKKDISNHIFGHYLRAALGLFNANKYTQAKPYIIRAIELWPDDPDAHFMYGFLLLEEGRNAEAIKEYETVLKLAPERIPLRSQVALHYYENGNVDRAILNLKAILDINPEDHPALINLGYILSESGRYVESMNFLERAYNLAPDNPAIIDAYAWITFKSGDYANAIKIAKKGGKYYQESAEIEKRWRQIMQSASED